MPHNIVFKTDQVAVTENVASVFNTSMDIGREYYGLIKNIGSEPVYVGSSAVTADCGYQLDSDEVLEIKFIEHDDEIGVICESEETSNISWFLSTYA